MSRLLVAVLLHAVPHAISSFFRCASSRPARSPAHEGIKRLQAQWHRCQARQSNGVPAAARDSPCASVCLRHAVLHVATAALQVRSGPHPWCCHFPLQCCRCCCRSAPSATKPPSWRAQRAVCSVRSSSMRRHAAGRAASVQLGHIRRPQKPRPQDANEYDLWIVRAPRSARSTRDG